MIRYTKIQFGWVIVIFFVAAIVFMTLAWLYQWGNNPVDKYSFAFFVLLFSGILLNFYCLTVIVDEKQIILKFGIGLYRKKMDLSSVRSAEIVTNPFCYGYGIRIIPNGILYNVSGNHAVELKFINKKSVIRIGTNDCEKLKTAIENSLRISNRSKEKEFVL
ncbi:MAG: hypothetical protein HZB98_05450 [Bacteroidia bacterium]|nr:hypothetical protein [Bacteroidia bacterium]